MLPVREKVVHTAVRIRFSKTGNLQYISHLDLQRTFTRILVRHGIPVWYSEGYSPHPRLVFATPLSVGAQSLCELLDVYLIGTPETIDVKEICDTLMRDKTPGLRILDVYFPQTKFSEITDAEYEIRILTKHATAEKAMQCENALREQPLRVLKRTKSGEKETDISPFIRAIRAEYADGCICIYARLCADNSNFLNPEYLVRFLTLRGLVLCGSPLEEEYSILRTAVLCNGNNFT